MSNDIKAAAAVMGRKGGKVKSRKKTLACRANGRSNVSKDAIAAFASGKRRACGRTIVVTAAMPPIQ